MSRIGYAKRKFVANFWDITVRALVGALLSLSFYMLVKAQILYGVAESLRVTRGALDVAATIFGLVGLIVGIPSLVAFFVGSVRKKY